MEQEHQSLRDAGVTFACGYRAAAVCAHIKADRPDLALLVSDRDSAVAGVFTRNRAASAAVTLCRRRLAGGIGRAIVVNSGNANAWTGVQGEADAAAMAEATAAALGVPAERVFVCSTGTIGVPLPMERVRAGIAAAAEALAADAGEAAARAIMTTDTVTKQAAMELEIDGSRVRIGGMAKGAGMIQPDMATMLAFITTDANVERGALQTALAAAVEESFNRITVDGDQSTNDTVLALANGAAESPRALDPGHPQWRQFREALARVCLALALKIVEDGEGATRLVTVRVKGAATTAEAKDAARAIANSLLVKTSWTGGDPNWGRVVCALGYSGAVFEPQRVRIRYDETDAVRDGAAVAGVLEELEDVLALPRFTLEVDLRNGDGTDTVYTCDISEEYVRINSEYTT